MPRPWFTIETRAAPTRQVGSLQITPFNEVWQFRAPGWQGGAIWNRPVSLLVNTEDGTEQVLPVPDPTRAAILKIAAYTLLVSILISGLQKILHRSPSKPD